MVWFQDTEILGSISDWEGFVRAFRVRFGPSTYDDLMKALTKLRKTRTVEAHKVEFENLSNRLHKLSDSHKLSYFLSVLKDEIRLAIRIFSPPDLLTAFSLAKFQEELIKVGKRTFKNPSVGLVESSHYKWGGNQTGQNFSKAIVPVQKINSRQMKEMERTRTMLLL